MKIRSITITRAEGPNNLCGITKTFTSFKDANAWLFSESHTFPKTGGYDKHDFKIVFEDGEDYTGVLDCKHFSCEGNDLDLLMHVKEFVIFHAGRKENPWMGKEEYRKILDMIGADSVQKYGAFIDNYISKLEVEA